MRCSPGEDATNGFFVSLFVRESLVVEATSRSKRKLGDDSTQKDNDGHQQKRRKRKKRPASST